MKKTILLFMVLSLLTIKNEAQTITDYDGNVYDTVIIGTQVWMKQNLKVTHYNNGVAIPNVKENTGWSNLTTGARCYYNNDSATNNIVYGALYNWYAVSNINKICPRGWHIPTEAEWIVVENFLGGDSVAGGKMKEAGTTHWSAPNIDATNSSRFTGLPGGCRDFNSNFKFINDNGLWWTATEVDAAWAKSLYFWNQYGGVDHNPGSKKYGFSVRCVRDAAYNGVTELSFLDNIKIYPNPAANKITIEQVTDQNLHIQIYSVFGECVLQSKLVNGIKDIDVSSLSKGIYIIIVSSEDWTLQKKLIKE